MGSESLASSLRFYSSQSSSPKVDDLDQALWNVGQPTEPDTQPTAIRVDAVRGEMFSGFCV